MDFIIDFILRIGRYLIEIVQNYHTWTYAILFSAIFCEAGLVAPPFLPGGSFLVCGLFLWRLSLCAAKPETAVGGHYIHFFVAGCFRSCTC